MALMLSVMKVGLVKHPKYNSIRGAKVIDFTRNLLDQSMPLAAATWTEVSGFTITNGALEVKTFSTITSLLDAGQFVGSHRPSRCAKQHHYEKKWLAY